MHMVMKLPMVVNKVVIKVAKVVTTIVVHHQLHATTSKRLVHASLAATVVSLMAMNHNK
jgi:hypothetical protein